MKLLKALIISFSMYSGIPMPQFEWKEEDMKYMLCFFPWIGAVIGLGIVLWSMLCKQAELGMLCYTMGGQPFLCSLPAVFMWMASWIRWTRSTRTSRRRRSWKY